MLYHYQVRAIRTGYLYLLLTVLPSVALAGIINIPADQSTLQAAADIARPVPFHDRLEILSPGSLFPCRLQCVDQSGKTIFDLVMHNSFNLLDMSSFPEGFYLLRCVGDKISYTKKIIKI